jgi:hypothetical protein
MESKISDKLGYCTWLGIQISSNDHLSFTYGRFNCWRVCQHIKCSEKYQVFLSLHKKKSIKHSCTGSYFFFNLLMYIILSFKFQEMDQFSRGALLSLLAATNYIISLDLCFFLLLTTYFEKFALVFCLTASYPVWFQLSTSKC